MSDSQYVVDVRGAAAPFLDWLPGETLFGLCSRLHRLWGHAFSWQTTEHLFGDRRSGTHHDLPNRLEEFSRRTDQRYGTAIPIATERTLLRFYSPFMSPQDVLAAAEAMQGTSVAHLKFRLGLLTSRFRANHPLKACLTCMGNDVKSSGWSTWRIAHQFPGVWWCSEHDEPLLTSSIKSTGVERFLWHLPELKNLTRPNAAPHRASQELALRKLGNLVHELLGCSFKAGWLDASSVQGACQARMLEMGLLMPSGRARASEAAAIYLAHCEELRSVSELFALPSNLDMAKSEIGRLTRSLRSGTHPVRLLVAINWLFSDASDFIAHYGRGDPPAQDDHRGGVRPAAGDIGTDSRKARVLELIGAGQSTTSVARSAGIAIGTAMSWAAEAGIATRRRSKILIGALRESLLSDLRQGADKQAAAARHGVSVETVTRTLHTEVGLHQAWRAARFSRARDEARAAWLTLQADFSAAGTKLIRAMNPAAYAWLYRNDRDWLTSHTPGARNPGLVQRASSVKWDERDRELCSAVERTVHALVMACPGQPVLLWHIYQALPELKPKLSKLDRLPLTRQALELSVRRKRAQPAVDLFDASLQQSLEN